MRTASLPVSRKSRAAVFAVAIAMAAPVFGTAVPAGAAPNSATTFQFKGRAGSTILTDCSLDAPLGTHCRAVNVFAFEQSLNSGGDKSGSGPGMDVSLFDVTITAVAPFFDAVEIGSG